MLLKQTGIQWTLDLLIPLASLASPIKFSGNNQSRVCLFSRLTYQIQHHSPFIFSLSLHGRLVVFAPTFSRSLRLLHLGFVSMLALTTNITPITMTFSRLAAAVSASVTCAGMGATGSMKAASAAARTATTAAAIARTFTATTGHR
jgi:hypothetical protein